MSTSQTHRLVAVIPLAKRPKANRPAVRRYVIAPAMRPPAPGVRAP